MSHHILLRWNTHLHCVLTVRNKNSFMAFQILVIALKKKKNVCLEQVKSHIIQGVIKFGTNFNFHHWLHLKLSFCWLAVSDEHFSKMIPYPFKNIDVMFAMVPVFKTNGRLVALVTKNWDGPIKFNPGQVKFIIDYTRREYFWIFLGD